MGHKTTIFGYIECCAEDVQVNKLTFDRFTFDNVYPFVKGFDSFIASYKGVTIPFSQNFKGDARSEWQEWIDRFEELLHSLRFKSATVIFDSEMQSSRYVRDYLSNGEGHECFDQWFKSE